VEEGGQVAGERCWLLGGDEVATVGEDSPSLNVVDALQIRARWFSFGDGLMGEDAECCGRLDADAVWWKEAIVPVVAH
jgi:hypothetical protein